MKAVVAFVCGVFAIAAQKPGSNLPCAGLVESTLGPDKKPVYKGGDQLSNKTNFDQWFRDVPGVNRRINFKMDLNKTETGTYVHDNPNFFPADGKGWKELC